MKPSSPSDTMTSSGQAAMTGMYAAAKRLKLKFDIFYHPHVCAWIKALNQKGISGLLTLDSQHLDNDLKHIVFKDRYAPTTNVDTNYPHEDADFRPDGAYSLYDWELFFHIPLLVATRLSRNQQFQEAQKWFHYVFNPTDSSSDPSPQRYWKVLPFYLCTESDRIEDLLKQFEAGGADSQASPCRQDLQTQVKEWEQNPFNPHLIARMRLIAYQKCVVMRYLDNLIAWGDQLFSQDTMESINEATQLYILAADILGPRPERVPNQGTMQEYTYHDLLQVGLDQSALSDPVVSLENEFPLSSNLASQGPASPGAPAGQGLGSAFYFCIPQNDNLLAYWDTVADRIFKIRNCMNIEGAVRELPLFAPPIDPALLVKAAAMGVDLSSALNDINAAIPRYRFQYMLQKALELCADVKTLGSALLATLEKKDAEALAALRAGQETDLLKAVKQVREQQIEEAQNTLAGLNRSKDVITVRRDFYQNVVKITESEQSYMDELGTAHFWNQMAGFVSSAASIAHGSPDISVGTTPGGMGGIPSPTVKAVFGGSNVGSALQATAGVNNFIAAQHTYEATMASIKGGYDRRWNDYKLQENLANKELLQVGAQIAAADIRVAIAQLESENHDKQIDNASAIQEFLREKYTNQDLYDWMLSQTAATFFQSYKLAYDIAKRAERAYRFERGLTTSNYVNFGYWDSLRKGLLSGEQLYLDLKRLEMAYLDQNKREYEITKHVSLVLHDAMALITLKETGQCEVFLPEALFDADYPGHYMRRIKSVSLSIPCVVGPYTNINCTLTLLNNKTRVKSIAGIPYPENLDEDDDRFVTNFAAMQSIATSHGQNDSGMFELNFRDERYLPFEGAGAISRWRIELPKDTNAFNFDTLTDVVLHLKYSAREGGEILKNAAKQALAQMFADDQTAPLARLFSLKHEFPTDWYRFLHPTDPSAGADMVQNMTIDLSRERFPFQFRGKTVTINSLQLFLKMKDGFAYDDQTKALAIHLNNDTGSPFVVAGSPVTGLPVARPASFGPADVPVQLTLTAQEAELPKTAPSQTSWWEVVSVNNSNHVRLNPDAIEDIWLVCKYLVTP